MGGPLKDFLKDSGPDVSSQPAMGGGEPPHSWTPDPGLPSNPQGKNRADWKVVGKIGHRRADCSETSSFSPGNIGGNVLVQKDPEAFLGPPLFWNPPPRFAFQPAGEKPSGF